MFRRGPNQQGSLNYNTNNFSINLFSSRLSIIDLDKRADQPFKSEDSVLIFNGEIYNFRELRRDLETSGYTFRGNSDTEVLLNLYLRDGSSMLSKLNGVFAFAIWDPRKKSVLLARDALGVKPLYYSKTDKGIVVSQNIFSFSE